MANLVPLSGSSIIKQQKSSIVKSDKFLSSRIKSKNTIVGGSNNTYQSSEGGLVVIQNKLIKIDSLLKDSLILSKKESEKKRITGKQKEFSEREKELEKKKPPQFKGINLPSLPKMGFLDWIKNFITQTLLGFLAVRLIDYLPQLLKIFPVIIKVSDFIIDIGGKLLNGLITFVDWSYKAIDGTRQFIKEIGGESLAQNFDKFSGALGKVIDTAIIVALATADSGVGGDLMDLGGDFIRDRFLQKGAQQAVQTGAQQVAGSAGGTAVQAGGIGAGAVAGIVAGAGLLASALGEGAFQLRKVATKPIQDKQKEFDKLSWLDPRKYFVGALLGGMKMILGPLSVLGVMLDIVGAPFRYAIELLRYPFLSEKDKQKQAYNLAKFDARIREDFRKGLNMLTLGFAFKEKGSFGNIYGNKDAQTEMMSKMAGGGKPATRGGQLVGGPAKRTIKKKKTPRTLRATPAKLKPGIAIGGEKKLKQLYPESKDKNKMSPFDFLKNSYEKFSRSTGLGSLAALAIKPIMGDKPSYADYKNAGMGVNNWMNQSIASGTLAYAGGGEVKMENIISGEDYSDVIAKALQDSVAPQTDKIIQDLMKQLMLKKEGDGTPTKPASQEDIPPGTGSLVGNTNAEKVFNYLIGYGFTEQAAAGVIGNLMQESSVNPQSRQLGGGPGRGIMQWGTGPGSGGRWDALVAWAESSGKDPWKLDTQVEWMMKEMRSYGTLNRLKGVTNVKKAVEIFESEMEKAGTPNYPRRYQFAADALASFGRGRAGGRGVPGNKGVVEYITGDPNTPVGRFDRSGHGSPGNYHDHIAFATIQDKERAKAKLRAAGIQIGSEYRPGDDGYHGKNLAIDVPGAQWGGSGAIGEREYRGSKKVREILGLSAYAKGGKVHGFTRAILGEEGPEFVIDADSTAALEQNYPGFLSALNKANYKQALQVLQNYASYNNPTQMIMIERQVPVPVPIAIGGGGSSAFVAVVNRNSSPDTSVLNTIG